MERERFYRITPMKDILPTYYYSLNNKILYTEKQDELWIKKNQTAEQSDFFLRIHKIPPLVYPCKSLCISSICVAVQDANAIE